MEGNGEITRLVFHYNKKVSKTCAVAKSDKFWRATGQSNLSDRMKDCSISQSAVLRVRKPNFGSFTCVASGFVQEDEIQF